MAATKTTRAAHPKTKAADVSNDHVTTAGQPITYETAGHPGRTDSPTYKKARVALHKIIGTLTPPYFGAEPVQDHHGGGLWVFDEEGWFFVRNYVGIEWSGQFCADPAKVDLLRVNAKRLYAKFPDTAAEFKTLGIDLNALLDTPITDAAGIAEWTDSICNASVPLPQPKHTGSHPETPRGGPGVHTYPTPVTDMEYFVRDDFQIWVTDDAGNPAAVAPVAAHGSGNSHVRVLHTTPGSKLHEHHSAAADLILSGDSAVAPQAFAKQTHAAHTGNGTKHAKTAVAAVDSAE